MNYEKIYEKIVSYAKMQNRKKTKVGPIYENHHIIPKSVGGSNDKNNLVLLTPKEHYICHKLLVEIYKKTQYHNKMYYAMWCLINGSGNQERYSPSSRVYNNFRIQLRKIGIPERLDNRKPIHQFKLNGEFIERYNSVKDASKKTNINSSSIENCGRGLSKSSGGFIWRYEKDIKKNEEITPVIYKKPGRKLGSTPWNKNKKIPIGCLKHTKKVLQYSLNGVLIKKWDCILVASNKLNISRGGIENCVTGKAKSSGGFIWKYSNEVDNKLIIPPTIQKPGRKLGSTPWNKKNN